MQRNRHTSLFKLPEPFFATRGVGADPGALADVFGSVAGILGFSGTGSSCGCAFSFKQHSRRKPDW